MNRIVEQNIGLRPHFSLHARLRRAGLELFASRLRQQGIRPWPLLLVVMNMNRIVEQNIGLRPHLSLMTMNNPG